VKQVRPQATSAQTLPGEERRRSQRVVIRVPVTLQITIGGKEVTIQAATASVNDHGAMLLSPRTIPAETTLKLVNDLTREEQTCRVTRAPIENTQGYLVPVEFAALAPGFWRISFPPADWKPPDD